MSKFVDTWFWSDSHFRHKRICEFEPIHRPFSSIEEHDEKLIQNYNSVVKDNDISWHIGDVAFGGDDGLEFLLRLKGRKKLVLGNHDSASKVKKYLSMGIFEAVYGVETIGHDLIMSHVPVHTSQVEERFKANIHGHLHSKLVLDSKGKPDRRYFNVSMEHINLTPIHYDEIKKELKNRGIY